MPDISMILPKTHLPRVHENITISKKCLESFPPLQMPEVLVSIIFAMHALLIEVLAT